MPVSKKERYVVFAALPTVFFIVAVILIGAGLLGAVPQEIQTATDWTAIFTLILAFCLYGQAGLQALED
jgi:hypothetical protein